MPQWTQETDLSLANHPKHISVLAIVLTPTDRNTPIPGGFDNISQIIRRADRSTGIQFRPTHTECTGKDFRHGCPPKFASRMRDYDGPTERTSSDCNRWRRRPNMPELNNELRNPIGGAQAFDDKEMGKNAPWSKSEICFAEQEIGVLRVGLYQVITQQPFHSPRRIPRTGAIIQE